MKLMARIFLSALCVTSALLLSSCGKKEATPVQKIEGTTMQMENEAVKLKKEVEKKKNEEEIEITIEGVKKSAKDKK